MADTNHDSKAAKTDAPAEASKPAAAPAHAAAKAEDKPAAPAKPAAAAPASAPAAAAPAKAKAAPARRAKSTRKTVAKTAPAVAAKTRRTAKAAVRTTSKTVNEGTNTMKNETNKVAERVQAAFGDVNARAKTAIERNTRFAEELTELGRGNVEALVASTKIVAKGLETIGQDVAEYGRKSFEDASAALKGFAEVKSPADFFRLQTEFVRGQFDAAVAESSKLSETMIKLAGDVAEPISNRATVAAERVRTAVAA
jgi:phasin family protein